MLETIIKFVKSLFLIIAEEIKKITAIFKNPDFKWPSKYQWRHFKDVLNIRERLIFAALLIFLLLSLLFGSYYAYISSTVAVPAHGGTYKEGILGIARYLNPILAINNDADRDLAEVVFSGLMAYDANGAIQPSLAKDYNVSGNGKIYEFNLRDDVFWHDGERLTADDVVFTIQRIQDPEYRSPLRIAWQGVSVERLDELKVGFKLDNAYAPFIENATIGILPKHIWEAVAPQDFLSAELNVKPIGSGPYQFESLRKDKDGDIREIEFKKFSQYFGAGEQNIPYIDKLIFKFYADEISLFEAFKQGEIDGINFIFPARKDSLKANEKIYSITLPRYFAVFFNQDLSVALKDKSVRLALSYATDKKKIVSDVLNGEGIPIEGPIPPGVLGYDPKIKVYNFSPNDAINILETAGWVDKDNDGFREKTINKQNVVLEINLFTTDWPELTHTVSLLKDQWEAVGVKVNLNIVSATEIQQSVIRTRQYDALLFGEVLGLNPDPFSFWHSSQKRDPGLNLSLYDNEKVDKLLEEARQSGNEKDRVDKLMEFQKIISEDIPAIFLYSPTFFYVARDKVKGIDVTNIATPSQRFVDIENWYIKTKRVKK